MKIENRSAVFAVLPSDSVIKYGKTEKEWNPMAGILRIQKQSITELDVDCIG